ncbi:MAG: helix-turn-helix domain-containing protein [Acidaminococcales bacterium]|jgi:transcriptional regulator with XRE-family HTH domain|nr:helix-turn-helix domain-containing protein [Acidaminococcales bacterium]
MEIASKLKELREKQHISKYKLAEITELSPTYIYKLEAGKSQPTIDTLERILKGLNSSLVDFLLSFSSADGLPELSPDERKLLDAYKSLAPDKKPVAIAAVAAMKG